MSNDLSLQRTSPAVDAGVLIPELAYSGGAAPDMGAMESGPEGFQLNAFQQGTFQAPIEAIPPAFEKDAFDPGFQEGAGVQFGKISLSGTGSTSSSISGSGSVTFAHPALAGTAVEAIRATGGVTFAHPAIGSTARVSGSGGVTFARPTLAGATADTTVVGDGSITFKRPTLAGIGTSTGFTLVTGSGGVTFAHPALAGSSAQHVIGSGSWGAINAFEMGPFQADTFAAAAMAVLLSGTGSVGTSGSGGVTFARPSLSGSTTAQATITGTGGVTFARPALQGTAGGKVIGTGGVRFAVPALNGAAGAIAHITGTGGVRFHHPDLSGRGIGHVGVRVKGYTIQLSPRIPDDSPLWRSPLWEARIYPPRQVIKLGEPNDPNSDPGIGPTSGPASVPIGAAPAAGTNYDTVGIFHVYGANATQLGYVRNAYDPAHFTYPLTLMLDRYQSNFGNRHPKIVFLDIAATFPGFGRTVWGYTPAPGDTMYIDQALRTTTGHNVPEVILSEFSHLIDRFGLSNSQRNHIKDLMGVPSNYGWRPPPPSGNVDWQHIPAECFMDVVLKIFWDGQIQITGFAYGLNGNRAAIRTILLHGYQPPPHPCDPGFHWDDALQACVSDSVPPIIIGPGGGPDTLGFIDHVYDGPELPAGDYSLRYQIEDGYGDVSDWAYDDSLTITEGGTDDPDQDFSAHVAARNIRVRVVLLDLDKPTHADGDVQTQNPGSGQYSRGPGNVVAVIDDAQNIGVSQYVSTPGELHFTLPVGHPQLSECIPYQRHYRIEQLRDTGWEVITSPSGTRLEGLLHDINPTAEDVVVYGYDYLGLLALSVENATQPDGNVDAQIDHGQTPTPNPEGSKYVEVEIGDIIKNQLQRAIDANDSPVGWIDMGATDPMPEPTTIYSAFVQRLTFIRGLIDSYTAGSGARSRVRVYHDPADGDRVKFGIQEDSGRDRPELRLEYGSLLQGFELVVFGDFAVRIMGIGHRPLNIKPLYAARNAAGMDTQVWGNIAKAFVWNDVTDEADLTRRVLQRASEFARIGKNAALPIRVRGLDPFKGWDLNDAIPLAIKRKGMDSRFWAPDSSGALTWWVILGMEWKISPDGTDELVLIVRPRIDAAQPLPDPAHPLLAFTGQHAAPEWAWDPGAIGCPAGQHLENGICVPDNNPHGGIIYGIDDSATVPAQSLKDDGVDFLIRKLTHGVYWGPNSALHPPNSTGHLYADALTNVAAFQSKGGIGGFYHFLTKIVQLDGSGDVPWNTGDKQCQFFISNMPNQSPEGYLAAVDFESNGSGSDVTWQGKVYSGKTSPVFRHIRDFINEWKATFPNHSLFVYSNPGQWGGTGDVKTLFANLRAWSAIRVQSGYFIPPGKGHGVIDFDALARETAWAHPGWGGFFANTILQFSNGIRIHGEPGVTDGDAFKGTRTQLLSHTTSGAGAAAPEEEFIAVPDTGGFR